MSKVKDCPKCKNAEGGCFYCNWTGIVITKLSYRGTCNWCHGNGCSKCGNYPTM